MKAFFSLFVALFTLSFLSTALQVTFDAPAVITNEELTPIRLGISGGDIGSAEVTKIRTVLYTPGKRSPKFYGNLTHTDFETVNSLTYEVSPKYSLPVQKYKIGFSVLVSSEGETEWVDSELFDTQIVDPQLSPVILFSAFGLLLLAIIAVVQLSFRLAAPGFWQSTLPAWTHKFLPEQPKQKRS